MAQQPHGPPIYSQSPDEIIANYAHNVTHHTQNQPLDSGLGISNGYHIQQPIADNFNAASIHSYTSQSHGFPDSMPHHPLPNSAIQNIHSQFHDFDGLENQSPVPEDIDLTEKVGKAKKGSASSLANDNELRRLLQQYKGQTLQSVAAEVHKTDGAGAKSEKPKQVFAMLWWVSHDYSRSFTNLNLGSTNLVEKALVQFAGTRFFHVTAIDAVMRKYQLLTLHRLESSSESFFQMFKLDGLA